MSWPTSMSIINAKVYMKTINRFKCTMTNVWPKHSKRTTSSSSIVLGKNTMWQTKGQKKRIVDGVPSRMYIYIDTSGFRSRWTTPWRWKYATTLRICIMTNLASSSEYFPPLKPKENQLNVLEFEHNVNMPELETNLT